MSVKNLKPFLKKSIYAAVGVVITALYYLLSSAFFYDKSDWYLALHIGAVKPNHALLFILYGCAYLIFAAAFSITLIKTEGQSGLLFLLNNALLALWFYIFFTLNNILAALMLIVIMLMCALTLFEKTYKESRLAAIFTIPYVGLIAFLIVLNYSAQLLN